VSYARLAANYGDAGCVVRGGRSYPCAIWSRPELAVESLVSVQDAGDRQTVELLAGGRDHLASCLVANPRLHDGPVLAFVEMGARMVARPASYFEMLATCDALRDEWEAVGSSTDELPPLRREAHRLADGRPLQFGGGRVAAIGVAVAIVVGRGARRQLLVGRRGEAVVDPGLWHVAPSGMLEPAEADPVLCTIQRELEEELGVALSGEALVARLRVLGVGHDLLRLRPELCFRLDLDADEIGSWAVVQPRPEFSELAFVPLDVHGLARFWESAPPGRITPAGAASVALLEESL
jgi:8-oxo-dGTP pyrophosphatase MutT (NUDIX family)